MSFSEFFKVSVLEPRLVKSQVLVLYDPDDRFRNVCLEMATETRVVVDCSESSIESRSRALIALKDVGSNNVEQLLVYVPKAKPIEDEEKQNDPYATYAVCGDVFPSGDGDSYLSLCLRAKPDHATQIREIFANDASPSFSTIDAIGGGLSWPVLRDVLNVESTSDILYSLLAPKEKQKDSLDDSDAWVSEVKSLLKASIGLALKTRSKKWSGISDELWRYVLFSEFVFDLPEELPTSLVDVPRADENARPLIEDLCDKLRDSTRTQSIYIDRAEAVELELELPVQCVQINDLGDRDTFPFEERTFLLRAMEAISNDDADAVDRILSRHSTSVWAGKGESQAQWDLIRASHYLIRACQDNERLLTDQAKNMDSLIEFYVGQMRKVDRLHREFEQSVSDYEWQDAEGVMMPVKQQARKKYTALIEKSQLLYTRYLQDSGWPTVGRLNNSDVFDKYVGPKLENKGSKVAYLMVDALRYEMGVELEKGLSEDNKVELKPALAQLPSITLVGMASLLPGAGEKLKLVKDNDKYVPFLGEQKVATVDQRMDVLKKLYGNRFQEGRLEDYVRNRFDIEEGIDLLVLRSVEIDSYFENHPDTAPNEIINALKRIRVAINKLKAKGFNEVVIATDHGFFMNTNVGAGDTLKKLQGDWINEHQRCLLGDGVNDPNHYMMNSEKLGVKGDFSKFAGPLSMAAYKSGMLYYHGGASLQECIVPVITLHLDKPDQEPISQATVSLNYKNGATRITTRLPVIDISLETEDMFSVGSEFEILLEAYDKKGDIVGEAKHGGVVNSATGTIILQPGKTEKISLRMQTDFEGKFKVKALNPVTMAVFCQLDLETDYAV